MAHNSDHVGPHILHQIEEVTVRDSLVPARYPADLGSQPHEKQILFEVMKGRHLGRRGNVGEGAEKDETIASAALYMPADALNTATNVSWSEKEIGIIGGAVIEMMSAGTPATTENLKERLMNTALAGAGGFVIDQAARRVVEPVLEAVTAGGDGKAILQSIFGQQIDPRLDMLFDRVQYRTHTFSFTLIPRNETEAKGINRILNTFQFYMLPKYGGDPGEPSLESYFIGYPYEFDITFITGTGAPSPHINKIDRSVLTSCSINHASSQHVAFVGTYYPAATSLTLEFKEVRLQGRDNYGGKDGVMWHGSPETPHDPNSPISADDIIENVGINFGPQGRSMFPPGHPALDD